MCLSFEQDSTFFGGKGGQGLLPATQESRVLSMGLEDPLNKGMATHSSILAWKIPWTKEPGRLQSMGSHDLATKPPPTI